MTTWRRWRHSAREIPERERERGGCTIIINTWTRVQRNIDERRNRKWWKKGEIEIQNMKRGEREREKRGEWMEGKKRDEREMNGWRRQHERRRRDRKIPKYTPERCNTFILSVATREIYSVHLHSSFIVISSSYTLHPLSSLFTSLIDWIYKRCTHIIIVVNIILIWCFHFYCSSTLLFYPRTERHLHHITSNIMLI